MERGRAQAPPLYAAAAWCYNRDSTYTYGLVRITMIAVYSARGVRTQKTKVAFSRPVNRDASAAAVAAAAAPPGAPLLGAQAQAVGVQPAGEQAETG